VLRRLEDNAIIERRTDPSDGRRMALRLTASGCVLAGPRPGTVEDAAERLLSQLSASEPATTRAVLDTFTALLEERAPTIAPRISQFRRVSCQRPFSGTVRRSGGLLSRANAHGETADFDVAPTEHGPVGRSALVLDSVRRIEGLCAGESVVGPARRLQSRAGTRR